jgi:hypothetical protein
LLRVYAKCLDDGDQAANPGHSRVI